MEINENIQVQRNLKAIELEKAGEIEKAIALYELNLTEGFKGNHPYDRLATFYKNQIDLDNEIRVLEKAIIIFEAITLEDRLEGLPKLFVSRTDSKKPYTPKLHWSNKRKANLNKYSSS